MAMRESAVWKHIKAKAPGLWLRVENRVSIGMPDVVVLYNGQVHWVELKSLERDSRWLGTTTAQRYWISRWIKNGGKAWVLAKVADRLVLIWGDNVEAGKRTEMFSVFWRNIHWPEVLRVMNQFGTLSTPGPHQSSKLQTIF